MKCNKHPKYTGKKLGKRVMECPTCLNIYYEKHPEKRKERKEKVEVSIPKGTDKNGWICIICPFGKGMNLDDRQIEVMAKSALKFRKATGLGYTSYISALDMMGMAKRHQVRIIEWLRNNGKIKKKVGQQRAEDKKRRREVQ